MSSSSTTSEEPVLDMFRFRPDEDQMVSLLKKKMVEKGRGSKASHFIMPETENNCQTLDLSPGSGNTQSISTLVGFLKKMMMMVQGNDIPEVDIYNSDPRDLPDLMLSDSPFKAKEWLAFNRPDYKNMVSSRRKRTTKKGFWKITGKVRVVKSQQLPKSVTCKKRTLTYHEGRSSKSKGTNWVMQEYYLSNDTQLGSNSSPNQRTDIVLFRLKYKSAANVKSDNSKKLKDSSNYDDLADFVTGGAYLTSDTVSEHEQAAAAENHNHYMIPVAQKELAYQHISLGNGNHDDAMIQELCAQQGELVNPPFPPPEPPRAHQLPQMGNAPYVYTDEYSNWPSPNGDNLTNKINISTSYDNEPVSNNGHNIQNWAIDKWTPQVDSQPEQNLGSNFDPFQLQNCSSQLPILNSEQGNLLYANNCIGCNESQSQFQLQLNAQQGEFVYLPFPPPEPPRAHQLPQMGNAPYVYTDEYSNWPSPNGDNLTNKINISTGYDNEPVSNNGHYFQNWGTDERTPQVDSQPEQNLGSNFDPFQLLQLPILNSEQGNLLYANNCIGCNESQSQYSEFATLFP